MDRGAWGSDAPISMPATPTEDQPVMVDLGGFAFTTGGLAHNLTQADREALLVPDYAPPIDFGRQRALIAPPAGRALPIQMPAPPPSETRRPLDIMHEPDLPSDDGDSGSTLPAILPFTLD